MESRGVPFLLVTHRANTRYLTGFAGSAGIVLLGARTGNRKRTAIDPFA